MSTRTDLNRALDKALAEAEGEGTVQIEGQGWTAEVDAHQVGPVGVVVDRVRVVGQAGDVARRAQAITETLRPHGERLDAVEVAPGLGGAVLRTRPEDMVGGRYFEVEVDRRGAQISRHRRKPGGRVRESFAVTREELGRIVDGLGQVVTGDQD